MPATTNDARVYRWDDLPRDRPMARLDRRRIIGAEFMISNVFLEKGCIVPSHKHDNEQMAMVTEGALKFIVGEGPGAREEIVRAGEVLHLPGNVAHSAEALEDSRVLDIFSPVSEKTGIDEGQS